MKSKPFYRVEDGYCTCCHGHDYHKEECPVLTWSKEKENMSNADTGLYAIHISGPDSILAVESLEVAEQKKVELNKLFSTFPKSEYAPVFEANIVDWPYDRESHSEAVLEADWSDVG